MQGVGPCKSRTWPSLPATTLLVLAGSPRIVFVTRIGRPATLVVGCGVGRPNRVPAAVLRVAVAEGAGVGDAATARGRVGGVRSRWRRRWRWPRYARQSGGGSVESAAEGKPPSVDRRVRIGQVKVQGDIIVRQPYAGAIALDEHPRGAGFYRPAGREGALVRAAAVRGQWLGFCVVVSRFGAGGGEQSE
jgi:hypothetical protein